MSNTINPIEYSDIFIGNRSLIDVRAPIEFNKGAFPLTSNLPIMNDSEREKVGTCYKNKGQDAAIALGHELVAGEIIEQRVADWVEQLKRTPDAYLYCFRGGLRSRLAQQLINEAGVEIPYIEGGYKAMRQHLIDQFEALPSTKPIIILSGVTGSGKTEIIENRSEAIDLEGIANHRGSSFGKNVHPQPTQINFENNLSISLLKHEKKRAEFLLLEDEGFLIGQRAIPQLFFNKMKQAKIIMLEEPKELRLPRLLDQYITQMNDDFIQLYGAEKGLAAFETHCVTSLSKIQKRLGGLLHTQLQTLLQTSLSELKSCGSTDCFADLIEQLMEKYYDPMYQYQLSKKSDRIIFSGDRQAINEWLDNCQP